MTKSLGIVALIAAALVSGTASATQIVVGESRLVIDVQFWGRQRLVSENPDGSGNDIISYGRSVHGSFRIFPDDAPPPRGSTGLSLDGKSYGQDSGGRLPTGASFVTSRWLSPFPQSPVGDITHQVSPFPGSVADDQVVVGDRAEFSTREPRQDWFQVSDRFGPNSADDTLSGEQLMINIHSPLDFIDGFGLNQAFELDDLQDQENTSASGFFRAKVPTNATAVNFFEFFVDRLRVTPHVCKP
jgi:hypothetical protein